MNQDPFKKDPYLRTKLDEYHVEVPDFPRKPNRWGRFINFLASPAKDPIEPLVSTSGGVLLLKVAPLIAIAAFGLIQALILL
jgi:hypothetical protein